MQLGRKKDVNLDTYSERAPMGLRPEFEVRYTGGSAPVAAAVQQNIQSIDRKPAHQRVPNLDEEGGTTNQLPTSVS